jgi:hypothetical protein
VFTVLKWGEHPTPDDPGPLEVSLDEFRSLDPGERYFWCGPDRFSCIMAAISSANSGPGAGRFAGNGAVDVFGDFSGCAFLVEDWFEFSLSKLLERVCPRTEPRLSVG